MVPALGITRSALEGSAVVLEAGGLAEAAACPAGGGTRICCPVGQACSIADGACCPTGRLCGLAQRCCAAGQVCCAAGSGACADLQTHNANCGSCGHACAAGLSCPVGQCANPCRDCRPGETCCDLLGLCADLRTDDANCGACGARCPSGQRCSGGACRADCPAGLSRCGAACVDLQTNPSFCGSCTNSCGGATDQCVDGRCQCRVRLGPYDPNCRTAEGRPVCCGQDEDTHQPLTCCGEGANRSCCRAGETCFQRENNRGETVYGCCPVGSPQVCPEGLCCRAGETCCPSRPNGLPYCCPAGTPCVDANGRPSLGCHGSIGNGPRSAR